MIGLAHNLIQDFRFGLRLIKRSRVVALGVVISLGLGIGATASVFSFLDFFILRPLPVPESDRVVRLRNSTPANSIGFSYPESRDYVERSHSFSGIATYEMTLVGLAPKTGDQPRVTLAMLVSGNFFSMLQVKPAAGRGFLPQEDTVPGRDAVAVISHAEWQRDFGGAADVVGRAVGINGHVFTIVGVAPQEFVGIDTIIEPGIYIPRMMMQQADVTLDISNLTNRSVRPVNLVARLKPRVTVAQAKADIERISKQLEMEYPETNKDTRAAVFTQLGYRLARTPDNGRMGVPLFGVVFLVLGIACVNVSNLLLSTVPARTREMAVRVAMGAPRMRLLQQLLVESVILSSAGTLAGLLIASWCAGFLASIRIGSDLPLGFETRVDARVVIFALGVGLVSAFMSGAAPAWRCCHSDLNSFADACRSARSKGARRLLIAAESVYSMDGDLAPLSELSALAQESRLAVFRLLVKAGPEGRAAGEIARALFTPANTLSAQLLVLANAGLIRARREGRSIIYAINYLALRQAITPDRLLGRMTATMRFVTVASAPVGALVGGALATVIGVRGTLLVVGVLGLALTGAAVLWSPVRRHHELPAPIME